ncbi:LIC_13246 family protein [Leptospira sp. 'Mane']|uniref:LIC_13246 family protein n=1 Tax=Leptospira sp. 'Mane' TaxID=3387407 RepID=UPI00398A6282
MSESTTIAWRELTSRKEEFQHILRVLNHYYEACSIQNTKLQKFRQVLVESPAAKIRVFLSKIGDYEYYVSACILTRSPETQTWIHVDGISEERSRMLAIGNRNHPVFSITSLGDLFSDHTEVPKDKFVPSQEQKKLAKSKSK